jgi:hypothetical protein
MQSSSPRFTTRHAIASSRSSLLSKDIAISTYVLAGSSDKRRQRSSACTNARGPERKLLACPSSIVQYQHILALQVASVHSITQLDTLDFQLA